MADAIDTSIYKNVGANNQAMTPLQVLQLVTQANENKLFQQTYDARQGIADAYAGNVDQNGNLDTRGLQRAVAMHGGFLAPQAVGQGIANSTSQFQLQQAQQKDLQGLFGSLASLPNPTISDVRNLAAKAAQNTNIPPEMIVSLTDGAAQNAATPKALKQYLANQSILSLGTGALGSTAGPPDAQSGQPKNISVGESILNRAGVGPGSIGAQSGGIQTGMPTAMAPGFKEAASAGGTQFAAARARAANFGTDIYPLNEALDSLKRLGTTGTGPGTDELNTFKSFLQSNLSWLPGVKIDPNNIEDFDKAKKYLTQAAGSRAAAFGHGTDQALSTALTANPNLHISNLAAVDLTKATIALRRMEQVQTLEADRQNVQPGQFGTWAARWAGSVDPRAFMVDKMNKQQLANVQKTLKTQAQRNRFNQSVQLGIANGVIDAPPEQ